MLPTLNLSFTRQSKRIVKWKESRTDHCEISGSHTLLSMYVRRFLGPFRAMCWLSLELRIRIWSTKRVIHSTIEYANVNYSYVWYICKSYIQICICLHYIVCAWVCVCVCRIGAGNAAYGNILNTLLPLLLLAFRLVVVVCANKWSWRHTLRPDVRWFSRRCNMRHMHTACPQPERATT